MLILYKSFIKKTKFNLKSSLRFGTIASLSMLLIILFFGIKNIMLAFPIALSGIALSFENIKVHPIRKVFYLILLNSSLIILAFLANQNIILGLIINSITLFLIGYFFSFSYNIKLYKPFLMFYIFTNFSDKSLHTLTTELFSSLFGSILVILLCIIITESKSNTTTLKAFKTIFSDVLKQLSLCAINSFDKKIYNKVYSSIENISYTIYVSKSYKDFSSPITKLQINLLLELAYINNLLYKNFTNKSKKIDSIILNQYLEIKSDNYEVYDTFFLNNLLALSKYNNQYNNLDLSLSKSLSSIASNIYKLKEFNIYEYPANHNIKSSIAKKLSTLHFKFNLSPIKTKFALRLSITLTACLFISHVFNYPKIIWVTITIMSVMQIYSEDTRLKSKDRIKGNIIGLIIFIIFSCLHIKILIYILLILSLYFTYGFKEYYKISIFTTLASLSATFLYTNMQDIIITRFILVCIGLIVVFISNKFLFPIRASFGVQVLLSKLLKISKTVFDNKCSQEEILSATIYIFLTTKKLSLRSPLLNKKNFILKIRENTIPIIDIIHSKSFKQI